MKYRKILIFLIICIIVLSSALITFTFLTRDTNPASKSIDLNQNTSVQNFYENNVIQNVIEENSIQNNNIEDNNTDKQTKNVNNSDEKNKQETVSHSEEESKENEKSKQDKENIAIELTKNEWGEDDTVYYTIDRNSDNVFDISVRSKSTTQTLAEYEVDIINKTVEIK